MTYSVAVSEDFPFLTMLFHLGTSFHFSPQPLQLCLLKFIHTVRPSLYTTSSIEPCSALSPPPIPTLRLSYSAPNDSFHLISSFNFLNSVIMVINPQFPFPRAWLTEGKDCILFFVVSGLQGYTALSGRKRLNQQSMYPSRVPPRPLARVAGSEPIFAAAVGMLSLNSPHTMGLEETHGIKKRV